MNDDASVAVNGVKAALASGRSAVGTMVCELPSMALVRMLARGGLEFIIFDTEHGVFSYETLAVLTATARQAGVAPIVRIPEIRKETVSRTLDVGALGLLVPQVRHEDEVRQVVNYAKYAPLGERGLALGRTHTDYVKGDTSEWMARLNANTMVIVQIETVEALDRVEAIAAVPGVDALFIGPNDLASALGIPGELNHPRLLSAYERVIQVAESSGIAAGIHLFDLQAARTWKERGIRLLTVSNDITMIVESSRSIVAHLR